MKAIVKVHLERPSRLGRTIVTEKFEEHKENLVDVVNSWISRRVSRKNFIPVKKFEVSILDYKNRVVNAWSYMPTYRED